MEKIIRIGVDTSKSVFQLHGVNAAEMVVLKRQLRRSQFVAFFAKLEPTKIGIEAYGGAHYWGRELKALGHEVVLLPPQYVKPYVKRGKNDAADAAAICEAMSRPSMRFVPVKSAEQEAGQMLAKLRASLVKRRTQMSNAIRGYAAEFGLVAAKGLGNVEPLLGRIASAETVPQLARELFAIQGQAFAQLQKEITALDARLMAWHRGSEVSLRLVKLPGVGPIGAMLLAIKAGDARAFRSGRDFSAWIGLTPKNHSTAGKTRLGAITRAGDEMLRSVLVVGATALIQQSKRGRGHPSPWLADRADPAEQARPGASLALAGRAFDAQATQARRRGARQQDRAHRLEADGQRRTLQPRSRQGASHGVTRRRATIRREAPKLA